jgi:hypothetical protein
MLKFDNFTATQDFVRNAAFDRDRLLVQLLTTMTDRIVKLEQQVNEFGQWRGNADTTAIRLNELEAGLGKLTDLTAGGLLDPFDERVLQVLDVRSGTARLALGLDDADVERWMLSVIEENSGEVFGHIEAEIEEKLEGFLDSNSFNEAISGAVRTVSGLSSTIEEILDGLLHDAIIDAIGDPEDIVRKGLRSIL